MKLTFKTVTNKVYFIEAEPSDTIAQCIEKVALAAKVDPAFCSIVFKGQRLLNNETTVQEVGLSENVYAVLYISKKKIFKAQASNPPQKHVEPKVEENKSETSRADSMKATQTFISPSKVSNKKFSTEETNQKLEQKPLIEEPHKEPEVKEVEQKNSSIKQEKTSIKTLPSCEPLPELIPNNGKPDPPGFEKKVEQLMELGYSRGDCECALRSAIGNLDRAVECLLTGYFPDPPEFYEPPTKEQPIHDEEEEELNPNQVFDDEEEEDPYEGFRKFREELIRNPEALQSFLQQMAEDNPEMAPLIRRDPGMFLVNVGLNPNDFDLSKLTPKTQFEELMEKFSPDEQTIIHRLEKRGFDTMEILQVFDACDRNETLTADCLMSMQ